MKMHFGIFTFAIVVMALQGPKLASSGLVPENESVAAAEYAPISCYGVKDGERVECVFPFKYKGRTYHRCTSEYSTNGASWCATSVFGYDRQVHQNAYADCLMGCN